MTNNNTTTQFVIKSLVVNVSLEIFYPPPLMSAISAIEAY